MQILLVWWIYFVVVPSAPLCSVHWHLSTTVPIISSRSGGRRAQIRFLSIEWCWWPIRPYVILCRWSVVRDGHESQPAAAAEARQGRSFLILFRTLSVPDLNQFGIRLLQCVYIRVCWWSAPLVIPEFTSTPTSLSTVRSRVIDVVADVARASVFLRRPSPSSDNSFRYRSNYNEQRLHAHQLSVRTTTTSSSSLARLTTWRCNVPVRHSIILSGLHC